MKKRLAYYFLTLVPLLFLIYAAKSDSISSEWFVISLMFYGFIYRPLTDYYRLLNKHVIVKMKFYQIFIPWWQMQYLRELYLN